MYPIFRKEVYTIFISQLFALYTLSTFGSYMGVFLDRFEVSAIIIGVVFTSRNLIQIFLRVPFSELSQMIGRKPLILTGMASYTISLGLLYLAQSWWMILIATMFIGIGMSLHWPAVFSYIGDISNNEYGRINGIIFVGQDLGVIIGSISASYLLGNEILELQGLFGFSFLLGVFGVVLSSFILDEVIDEEDKSHPESIPRALYQSFVNIIQSLVKLTRIYPLNTVFLLELLVTFTEFFIASFIPLLMVLSLGYSEARVADLFFYSTLILIFFKPLIGKIFDRFGFKWPIILGMGLTSGLIYLMPLVTSFAQLLLVYTVYTAALFTCFIATSGGTSNSASAKDRGLAMGVLGIYISTGRMMSSVVLAPVLEYFEYTNGSRELGLRSLFEFGSYLILGLVLLTFIILNQFERKQQSRDLS
ncbi:MAG: MFS transporter [Candidatus Heimdallarchaeota archaeon]|nr:MFS transporter [Candidatus Heimdallarchaeota archaeon]